MTLKEALIYIYNTLKQTENQEESLTFLENRLMIALAIEVDWTNLLTHEGEDSLNNFLRKKMREAVSQEQFVTLVIAKLQRMITNRRMILDGNTYINPRFDEKEATQPTRLLTFLKRTLPESDERKQANIDLLRNLEPLFNFLKSEYLDKPMDASIAPAEYQTEEKRLERETATYNCTYKPLMELIPRSNHGVVHMIRSVYFLMPIIHYLKAHGTAQVKEQLKILLGDDEQMVLHKIAVTAAFSSVGRESEIDWSKQPEVHYHYRERAGAIFQHYYDDKNCGEVHSMLRNAFPNATEFEYYKKQLIAIGNPENTDILHVILNMAHKLELYRCRGIEHAQETVDQYIRPFCEETCGNSLLSLTAFAATAIQETGDRVNAFDLHHNQETFRDCSLNISCCTDVLAALPDYENEPLIREEINPELREDFYVKSVDYALDLFDSTKSKWRPFIETITHSPISFEHSSLRNKRDATYTLRLNREQKIESVKIKNKRALYSPREKQFFSKPQSLSFASPRREFYTKVADKESDPLTEEPGRLVGARFNKSNVLLQRIFYKSSRTRLRFYDANTVDELDNSDTKKQMCTSLEELTTKGCSATVNEIMGRVKGLHSICIFEDSLAARLQAQYCAKVYENRIKELALEFGEDPPTEVNIPITFYLQDGHGRCLKNSYYTPQQQEEDLEAAKALPQFLRPFDRTFTSLEEWNIWLAHQALHQLEELKRPRQSKIAILKVSPFQIACANGQIDKITDYFSKQNPQSLISYQDTTGKTALHYAAANGHEAVLRLLLQNNNHYFIKDNKGFTFIDYLVEEGWNEVLVNLFRTPGSLYQKLYQEVQNKERCDFLLRSAGMSDEEIHALGNTDSLRFQFFSPPLTGNRIIALIDTVKNIHRDLNDGASLQGSNYQHAYDTVMNLLTNHDEEFALLTDEMLEIYTREFEPKQKEQLESTLSILKSAATALPAIKNKAKIFDQLVVEIRTIHDKHQRSNTPNVGG